MPKIDIDAQEIIERIMTTHWDLAACPCWICEAGRKLGYHPREGYPTSERWYKKHWSSDSVATVAGKSAKD